jgi:hypothetical protein
MSEAIVLPQPRPRLSHRLRRTRVWLRELMSLQGSLSMLTRAMRVEARQVRYHLFRFAFAGFIVLCLLMAMVEGRFISAPGLTFFSSLCFLNWFFIMMAGISFFATSITEEKEEDTLGLLKMAGLSPLGILLGKSTSRLISAALLLAIQIPFALLAITLGGILMHQIVAAYVALAAFLVMVANAALFASVFSKRSSNASSLILLFLLGMQAGPWFLRGIGWLMVEEDLIPQGGLLDTWFSQGSQFGIDISIVTRIGAICGTGFDESIWSLQVISNLVIGLAFFALALGTFERFTKNLIGAAPSRGLIVKRTSRFRLFGAGSVWRNAFAWKDFYFITGGRTHIALKALFYPMLSGGLACFILVFERTHYREVIGGTIFWTMLIAVLIELVVASSRMFHDEMRWHTMATLIMVPVSIPRIAYSKVLGCLLSLLPGIVMGSIGALVILDDVVEVWFDICDETAFWYFVLTCILFLHLTLLLSLFVRWGAAPLAFVTIVLSNWLGGAALMTLAFVGGPFRIDEDVLFGLFDVGLLALIITIHFLIGWRLRIVGEQG